MSFSLYQSATQDFDGLWTKEGFQAFSATPPTDPTDAIPTTGASGTYTSSDVTSVVSSIDPSITNLGYKSIYDNGHAAAGKLVPTVLLAGFLQNGRSSFPDAMAQRMASYVDPISGRAPLVIKAQTRGRGNGGTTDYARDTQDVIDIIDAAVAAVGANAFGYSATSNTAPAIVIGYSTGGLDALSFAVRFPDRCLGVVLYYPNYDLGYDSADSYYAKNNAPIPGQIAGSVQPGGDVRKNAGAASIDQYMSRNVIDAIAKIMAIPNGPHVWLLSDLNETEALPSATRLKYALQSIPGAAAKAHIHLTQTGDSNRVLHADGVNGASEIYAERYFFPYLLKNATEWTMPRKSPAGGLRLLGRMQTKLFDIWMGPNTAPKTTASAGGKDHAAEFQYDDVTRRFTIKPLTSTNGYVQIIRDGDNRSVPFTANVELIVDLNVARSVSDVDELGYTKSWQSAFDVTDATGITSWLEKFGHTLDFTATTNKPTYATDANGKKFAQFASASSQKLVLNSLLVNPNLDFTISITFTKTNTTTPQSVIGMGRQGGPNRFGVAYNSGNNFGYIFDDAGAWAINNSNGLGGVAVAQNNIHVITIFRKNGVFYMAMDGGVYSSSPFTTGTMTITGTVNSAMGCQWANGGGSYYQFWDGGIYEVDAKQEAISEADVLAHFALMKSRYSF